MWAQRKLLGGGRVPLEWVSVATVELRTLSGVELCLVAEEFLNYKPDMVYKLKTQLCSAVASEASVALNEVEATSASSFFP